MAMKWIHGKEVHEENDAHTEFRPLTEIQSLTFYNIVKTMGSFLNASEITGRASCYFQWKVQQNIRPPSKIITIIFSEGIRRFLMPNLVLKTIMMIKKVYGAEICVFMAPTRGATSGLSLSYYR